MSDLAIQVVNLSKRYRIGLKEEMHVTFTGAITSWLKYPFTNFKRLQQLSKFNDNDSSKDIIWALKDVSFEVKHGEVLGIIGSNGAGKSTLLKVLSRITEPTSGYAKINGRVASLLEVGTGFHPELTGRENIYLNGTVLGMKKKEIDKKFDEIVDFSGVEKFIDTPVKRYSSGMAVRLAFSVAAHLEPEILLIDEVLAVGDVEFQKKCLGKIDSIVGGGRTVIFVSHNMNAVVSLCNKGILLINGRVSLLDSIHKVVEKYLQYFNDQISTDIIVPQNTSIPMYFKRITLLVNGSQVKNKIIDVFDKLSILIEYTVVTPVSGYSIYIQVRSRGEVIFGSFDTSNDPHLFSIRTNGDYETIFNIPNPLLKPGIYTVTLFIGKIKNKPIQIIEDILTFEVSLISRGLNVAYTAERPGLVVVDTKWITTKRG